MSENKGLRDTPVSRVSNKKYDEGWELAFGKRHDWKCTSPGMYDFTYVCQKCGATHTESIDNPETKLPERGCEK